MVTFSKAEKVFFAKLLHSSWLIYECEKLECCVGITASQFIQPLTSWLCVFHSVYVFVSMVAANVWFMRP